MKFISEHQQESLAEVESLIASQTFLSLITATSVRPIAGLYNFLFRDKTFLIHIGKKDEHLLALKENPRALITFSDVLSVIPSYWVDERYGGAINNFFRYAEFECTASIKETPEDIMPLLQDMLDAYQKEAIYDPLSNDSEIYRPKFAMLSVVEFKIESMRTKWNLGQTKPLAAFLNVIKELEKRGTALDLRTAEEMKKTSVFKKTSAEAR